MSAAIRPTTAADGTASTISRLSPKGRAVFTVKGWNDAIKAAATAAGNWWIGHYGVLRFNKGYATSALGYTRGGARPFWKTGVMASNFSMRARTVVAAKKGGLTLFRVTFPAGHALTENTANAFKKVPQREATAVAREFRRALIEQLQTGRANAARKAQIKAERQARAAANTVKRAERKAQAAVNRQAREQKRNARRANAVGRRTRSNPAAA